MQFRNGFHLAARVTALVLVLAIVHSCTDRDVLSLTVNARGRGVSAMPLIIAKDRGLFEKYGLNVTLLLPQLEDDRGRNSPNWVENLRHRIRWRLGYEQPGGDIYMAGGSPSMRQWIENAPAPHRIIIGATDCTVRALLIGQKGLKVDRLEDLAGMRIGAEWIANTGFHALLLADRMGWGPSRDIDFVNANTGSFEELDAGIVDVLFVYETIYASALEYGYPILFDSADWMEEVAGNSMTVYPEWLEDPSNREATKRFLMAVAEATSIYHQDRALALQILEAWNGLRGEFAERVYERGAWLPQRPYPCVAGLRKSLELYGAPEIEEMGFTPLPELEKHVAEEFYDDSILREIDENGFFDALYP
jgi:ABC-type nitrate/sulfonate/bicarbonate transport system substrate-binding protein